MHYAKFQPIYQVVLKKKLILLALLLLKLVITRLTGHAATKGIVVSGSKSFKWI